MLASTRRTGGSVEQRYCGQRAASQQTIRNSAHKGQQAPQHFSGFNLPTHNRLIAIDIEYAHFLKGPADLPRPTKFAAEVCLIDSKLGVEYHSYIRPGNDSKVNDFIGGVPWNLTSGAPSLEAVRQEVIQVLQGRCVIGLGLKNDLQALGLQPSKLQDRLDLCGLAVFQRNTHACSLKQLAYTLLQRKIQAKSGRHSAEEDAAMMMELYLKYAHTSPDCPAGVLMTHYLHTMQMDSPVNVIPEEHCKYVE